MSGAVPGAGGRLWDLVARRYRSPSELAKYRARAGSGLRAWEREVLRLHPSGPGPVLDIGCGSGREALALAGEGHAVVGVDTSPQQLAQARSNLRSHDAAVELVRSDGLTLPFSDGAFGHVVAWSQVLGNVPGRENRGRLLAECGRVLRRGGWLSLSVHDRDATARAAANLVAPGEGGLEDGDFVINDAPESAPACYWHYFTRGEIVSACGRAGLDVVRCCTAPELGDLARKNLWICVCRRGPV